MKELNRITNGWYIFHPFDEDQCNPTWLDTKQVVQVIEGMVWATYVSQECTVRQAKRCGKFISRVSI